MGFFMLPVRIKWGMPFKEIGRIINLFLVGLKVARANDYSELSRCY